MSIHLRDLAGQLAAAMMTVVVLCLAISIASFYVVYAIMSVVAPGLAADNQAAFMDSTDLVILLGSAVIGLTLASWIAVRLARKVAGPLRSVADAAHRIAQGDLTARAAGSGSAPTEAQALVMDFNDMAGRLQGAAGAIVIWNAQIAHELRTPLTILRGRIQGLIDGVFEADDRSLHGLLTQVQGLSRLVEDLRIVSLSDSGNLDFEADTVELAAEIESLVHLVEPELTAAGFAVALDLDNGPARVDVARLRQAVLALIENARRHADPCTLVIKLKLNPDRAQIEVIDQGPGLPASFIDRAFDQFARGELPHKRRRGGSGLGLSVVKAISRLHGGDAVYRRDAIGSAFSLDLMRWST